MRERTRLLCAIILRSNTAARNDGYRYQVQVAQPPRHRRSLSRWLCPMLNIQKAYLPAVSSASSRHIRIRRVPVACVACIAFIALSLLTSIAMPIGVTAQFAPATAPLGAPPGQWRNNETTISNRFVIYFAQRDTVAPQVDAYKQTADGTLDMMRDLFGPTVLATPVPIYLMTDDAQFVAVVPTAKDDGTRFAGIDRNGVYVSVARATGLKPADLARSLRGLLAREMASEMSGGNMPAGLLDGLERYAQAPPADLSALVGTLQQQVGSDRLTSWNTLPNQSDAQSLPQNYSVVAFLMDTYGFRAFRNYAIKLNTTKDWRQAIPQVFINMNAPPETVTTLEVKWRAYVPQFLGGLWQKNQFAYYNTDAATSAVAAGQYTQAVALLTPAIPFLQQITNTKRATDAQALLSKARSGSAAETTVHDAQQALEGNDYEHTLSLVSQAKDEYKALGTDAKPSPLIAQYEARANRGKSATTELTTAETAVGSWNVVLARQKANNALGTFSEFGNAPLADRAQTVIARANREIRYTGLGTIGVGALVLLLGLTLTSFRRGRRQPTLALPPIE